MELGIFSRTYETQDLETTFQQMTSQGLYHTQFNLSNAGMDALPKSFTQEDMDRILSLSKKYKVYLDALSGTFNMIDPDVEQRKKGIEQFETQCEIASKLRIPIVTLCTGSKNPSSKWKWDDKNLLESSWQELIETTKQILVYADKYDVILGVETEASNIINTPQRARKYLDAINSPRLKIIMDGANLFLPSQVSDMHHVLKEAFQLLGKDIVLAHAKDLQADVSFVAAGQGVLDFTYYIQLLKEYGYTGPLIMHGLDVEQVKESMDYLYGCMAQ